MSSAQGLGVSWLCPCFCVLGVPPGCGAPMEYLASLIPLKQKQLPGDATEPPHSRPRAVSKGRSIARRTAPRMQGLGACSFVRWPPRSVTPCPAPMLSEQKVCWPGLLCEYFRERERESSRERSMELLRAGESDIWQIYRVQGIGSRQGAPLALNKESTLARGAWACSGLVLRFPGSGCSVSWIL